MEEPPIRFVQAGKLNLAVRELGAGPPVLLFHGWPTSSYLWRNVMAPIAERNRVIAVDLPGFGASDKPLDVSYSFRYLDGVMGDLFDALEVESAGVAGHDLGAPVALHWAASHPERVNRIALLNTLLYPELSWAVLAFGVAARIPGLRSWLTSRAGLRWFMRAGMAHPERLNEAIYEAVCRPFQTPESRQTLLQTFLGLHPGGFVTIAEWLPKVDVPVRIIYGARDRILPDVAKTMARVRQDIPHAELTVLEHCGHFIQEEDPNQVGALLAEFFGEP